MTRRPRVTLVTLLASAVALPLFFAPRLVAEQRGAAPPANQAQPVKGTGIISGRIVDAADDQPIDGAIVTVVGRQQLTVGAPSAARAGGPGPIQTRLLTGTDGRFVLHDLPAGSFTLNVSAQGYVSGAYGQSQPTSGGQPITLADAERVTDAKIRLWKTAVLTGTVIDDAGEPAVGISVHAYRRTAVAGRVRYNDAGSATTDDRGTYRISSLTPGEFVVAIPQTQMSLPITLLDTMLQGLTSANPMGGSMIAELMGQTGPSMRGSSGVRVDDVMLSSDNGTPLVAGDGRLMAYQTIFYPAAATASQATSITLRSGEERAGADLQLRVVPTARVTGVITMQGGSAGMIQVRLMPVVSSETASGLDMDVGNATSLADGTFTFLGIPPGQYVARVYQPPRPAIPPELASNPIVQTMLGGPGGSAVALYGETPVSVGGTDVTNVAISLTPGVKLSGRLEFVGASPQPTPQQLRALAVSVQSMDGRPVGQAMFTPGANPNAVTEQGEFTLAGYPPGRYVVNASASGAWIVKSILAGGRDVLHEPLEVKDSDINGIVVSYTDRIGQIAGTVHGVNGATLTPGAAVILFPADYQDRIANGDGRAIRNVVVTKGAYTIGALLAGDYLVAAFDGLDVPDNRDAAFFDALARVATHVRLAEGEKKTLDLTPVKVVR